MPAIATKEKPILFSAPMVRAILDGRKTQTRRVIIKAYKSRRKDGCKLVPELLQKIGVGDACPYGAAGGRLWVRETWMPLWDSGAGFLTCLCPTGRKDSPDAIKYRADGEKPENFAADWRPSIHMPRAASRLTLEVEAVRVERLQEITEADAIAEGLSQTDDGRWLPGRCDYAQWAFEQLWNQINGKRYSWESSPWVWVVQFRRIEP